MQSESQQLDELKQAFASELARRDAKIANLEFALAAAEEEIRIQLLARFGKKSEKYDLLSHPTLPFNEAEEEAENSAQEPDEEISVPEHKRKKRKKVTLPTILRRVRIEHDLDEHQKTCPKHGVALKKIGEDTSEKLEIEPEKIYVAEHVRPKYSCPCCEGNIVQHPMPPLPLPGSMASASLLSYILVSKYVDHMPLYRLEQKFQRIFVELPRAKMARWVMASSEILTPLYNLMEERLLEGGFMQMDETTVQVLKEKDRAASTKSQMWVRARDGTIGPPIILYDYSPSRSGKVISDLLGGYQGSLQTDGYAAYTSFCRDRKIVHAGCHAHVRRKFWQAFKASKERSGGIAKIAIDWYKKIYKIEGECKNLPPDERLIYRQKFLAPILTDFKAWIDKHIDSVPKSLKTGEALHYATSEWPKLIEVLNDGRIAIDNNFIEGKIRPFTIGRKKWMFSDTPKGAHASAMIYSVIETAKANGLEPFAYLNHILSKIPKAKTVEDFEALLPFQIH